MYRVYISILFAALMSSSLHASTKDIDPSGKTHNTPYPYDSDRTINQKYLKAINLMRSKPRKCGNRGYFKATTPVQWSDKLYKASLEHAHDMATHNLTHHQGSGKSTDVTGKRKRCASKASERGQFHGYNYSKAFAYAENVAAGHKNLNEVVKAWMQSPGHCANIMNPCFREVAMAKDVNPASTYKTYWTLNLGYRR